MADTKIGKATDSALLGWLIAGTYFIQSVISVNMPRTDKTLPLREELRGWHYLVGTVLLVLLIVRLRNWWRYDRHARPPADIGSGVWTWGRTLTLTSYILLALAPILGLLFAWSDGLAIHLGPLPALPALMGENYPVWMFTGYFHSGLSFMVLVLNVAALLTAAYALLRYNKGLLAAFPAGYGAQVFVSMAVTAYSLATFKSPDPGPMAVARYLGICGVVWAFAWLIHRKRAAYAGGGTTSKAAPILAGIGALALVSLGAYGPHAMFRVTPWPMGVTVAAPEGVRSHAAPVMRVTAWNETDFERDVANDTYKWCGFCHTFKQGDRTKAGPNLHAIFGQRAASVPGFSFSPALAAKRDAGLVWTDETLDAYLKNPDGYVPGTSMIISSGPVADPKVRRAVINMLKRDTMAGAIDLVDAPEGQ
jgi:cytochrome c2/cytochrome b561